MGNFLIYLGIIGVLSLAAAYIDGSRGRTWYARCIWPARSFLFALVVVQFIALGIAKDPHENYGTELQTMMIAIIAVTRFVFSCANKVERGGDTFKLFVSGREQPMLDQPR